MSSQSRLGWIGLGSMGLAMATNMQKHLSTSQLPPLQYWNRTISRGDSLKDIGGEPASSVEELVQSCDLIFISVCNHLPPGYTNSKHTGNNLINETAKRRHRPPNPHQENNFLIHPPHPPLQNIHRHNNNPPQHQHLPHYTIHFSRRNISLLSSLRFHTRRCRRPVTHRHRRT